MMVAAYLSMLPEDVAVRCMVAVAMAGVVLDCLEMLSTAGLYAHGGVFGSSGYHRSNPRIRLPRPLAVWLGNQSVFVAMIALELVCAVAALSGVIPGLFIGAVFAARVLAILRHGAHGNDGSDQMLLIVLASLWIYHWTSDPAARRMVLWFIAAESMLAYFTAGLAKLLHPRWRAGRSLSFVFEMDLFRNRSFARIFRAGSWRGLCGCWSVILFESLVPVFVFAGPVPSAIVLALAAGLHLVIAATMGLNLFVFAFLATYPAVMITVQDTVNLISAAPKAGPAHWVAVNGSSQAQVLANGGLDHH